MLITSKIVEKCSISWTLRCPENNDAAELSRLRVAIDGETENLDREAGEDFLSPKAYEKLIHDDSVAERSLFLVAEVDGKIIGFARCAGSSLRRYRHRAGFGICILKEYWGRGIGKSLMENLLCWADGVGIEKMFLTVVSSNTRAIQLYKRFGFVEEGVLVNDRIHSDGKYYDTVLMGRFVKNVSHSEQ